MLLIKFIVIVGNSKDKPQYQAQRLTSYSGLRDSQEQEVRTDQRLCEYDSALVTRHLQVHSHF
jgi:hypothetical protein